MVTQREITACRNAFLTDRGLRGTFLLHLTLWSIFFGLVVVGGFVYEPRAINVNLGL